jgi:class 3 adenylate cyclase
MTLASRLERALLWLAFAVACAALAAHTREVARSGLAEPIFFVTAPDSADAYPVVAGFRADLVGDPGDLRIGDRLIRVGDTDLRGRGHLGVDAAALAASSDLISVPVLYERDGERRETVSGFGHYRIPWSRIPGLAAMLLVCAFVLVRAPLDSHVRFLLLGGLSAVVFQSQFHGPDPAQTLASKALFYALGAVVPSLAALWALHFPPEAPRPPRVAMVLAWALAPGFALLRLSYLIGGPFPPAVVPMGINFMHVLFALAFLGAFAFNWRHCDPIGRRRMKWVLLGAYLGFAPIVLQSFAVHVLSVKQWFAATVDFTKLPMVLLPVGLLLAISRQNLFDVDRLLGATASASLLLAFFLALAGLLIPPAAQAASETIGVSPWSSQLALSVALAVGLAPLQRVLRPQIDRFCFVERYAAAEGVRTLVDELQRCEDPNDLLSRCADGLRAAFRATRALVYEHREDRFELASPEASGAAGQATFADSHPVVSVLRGASEPLLDGGRWRSGARLAPLDRATLETLGVAMLSPVRAGSDLLAMLGVGRRRSGDVYTPTDAALLGRVAATVAVQLLHYREIALGRYVPEAVRGRVLADPSLDAAEREVSILFVDIRGYTGMADRQRPEEIFGLLNRYTTRVSEIIRIFGGQVVEFHGDGLMAVFGAPQALVEKERAAVRAAREIVTALRAGDVAAVEPHLKLEVGVGIATGPAFVGNIRAIDRWIWSAVGRTTNLAARLQSLSRELEASIVIDGATRERCGDAGAGFVSRGPLPIRGLEDAVDVHCQPLGNP